jgi:hypothetical protein
MDEPAYTGQFRDLIEDLRSWRHDRDLGIALATGRTPTPALEEFTPEQFTKSMEQTNANLRAVRRTLDQLMATTAGWEAEQPMLKPNRTRDGSSNTAKQ